MRNKKIRIVVIGILVFLLSLLAMGNLFSALVPMFFYLVIVLPMLLEIKE